jgi:hypothetical protein
MSSESVPMQCPVCLHGRTLFISAICCATSRAHRFLSCACRCSICQRQPGQVHVNRAWQGLLGRSSQLVTRCAMEHREAAPTHEAGNRRTGTRRTKLHSTTHCLSPLSDQLLYAAPSHAMCIDRQKATIPAPTCAGVPGCGPGSACRAHSAGPHPHAPPAACTSRTCPATTKKVHRTARVRSQAAALRHRVRRRSRGSWLLRPFPTLGRKPTPPQVILPA